MRKKKKRTKDEIVPGGSTGREWTGRRTAAPSVCGSRTANVWSARALRDNKFSMAVFEFYRDAVVKSSAAINGPGGGGRYEYSISTERALIVTG